MTYPTTINMDCQTAEITDDEASVQPPKETQQSSEKEMDGIRPVTPTQIDQMREENYKDKELESITFDDDEETEEEVFQTYTQDSQEYMHWHYKLNHPSHTVMIKMAKQKMLPRRITNILTTMDKHHAKPPMCNDCCAAKATRKPWRSKGKGHIQSHIKKVSNPGDIVSVDQLESSIPGFIGQMTGKLTKQRIVASTIYVDHASDLSYVYHQTSMTSEETLKSKQAFEKFARSHGVNIKHYHADNGRFKENYLPRTLKKKDKPLASVE